MLEGNVGGLAQATWRAIGAPTCAIAALPAAVWVVPGSLLAQTLTGRVLDEVTEAPVIGVLVTLADRQGELVLQTESDSMGRYRIGLPGPGAYQLATERLGYEPGETPLLDLSFQGSRMLDLMIRPMPLPLPGLAPTVSLEERIEASLRRFGIAPGQLPRTRIVTMSEIESVATARDFGDVLRRQNIPGLWVYRLPPPRNLVACIQIRSGAGCATIVIDGAVAPLERAAVLPPEAWESMVVLQPQEATLVFGTSSTGGGAILLFSRGRAWR